MSIQVITDSTCDIPAGMEEKLDIVTVPIYLRFGGKTYRDGVDIKKDEFYDMLETSPVHPATSQPNPEDFASAYKENCEKDGIVSIHISSKISGTCNSARMATRSVQNCCPIEIVDSMLNSGGLGMVVTAAARLAQSGGTLAEVAAEARNAVNKVKMFGMFGTMKYLGRSGRVNRTIVAASRILNVMPLLTFHDGEIVRSGLVRSVGKGMDKIFEFVRDNNPISELVIVHSRVIDQAEALRKRMSAFIAEEKISIAEMGAGLGVHGGPGVILAAVRKV